MKNLKYNIVLALVIIGIAVLSYASYLAGYKAKKNELDSLLMTMTIDSNFVTAGLYEELPNKVRKTMHFYIEDTPTIVNDIKLYAEVKYATINGEEVNTEDGKIWSIVKREKVFERQFEEKKDSSSSDYVPNSTFALVVKEKNNK